MKRGSALAAEHGGGVRAGMGSAGSQDLKAISPLFLTLLSPEHSASRMIQLPLPVTVLGKGGF